MDSLEFKIVNERNELACEQALGLGVCLFVCLFVVFFFRGGRGGGGKEKKSLQRCLTNLNVSLEKVCEKYCLVEI